MKNTPFIRLMVAAGVLAGLAAAVPASAAVIGFEDFSSPGCCTFIPAGYQGFTWSGGSGSGSWVIAEESSNVFAGVEAHSGQNYAWSNGANDLSLSGAVFDLNELWARMGPTAGSATARGFLGAVEVYTQVLSLTDTHALQSLNFLGIDKFTLTDQTNNVLIDDILVNAANNVPEPGTLALSALALTLGGLRLSTRRRT